MSESCIFCIVVTFPYIYIYYIILFIIIINALELQPLEPGLR